MAKLPTVMSNARSRIFSHFDAFTVHTSQTDQSYFATLYLLLNAVFVDITTYDILFALLVEYFELLENI